MRLPHPDVPKPTYRFLPFRFGRILGRTLVVNAAGQYCLLDDAAFDRFVGGQLTDSEDVYLDLHAKHFLTEGPPDLAIEALATKYRTKKSFLRAFTSLHMVVLTVRCNQKCRYCQVACENASATRFDMQPDTARAVVETIFRSPSPYIKIEFQGGEPFLNFEILRQIVEQAEVRNAREAKNLEFVVCTNLTAPRRHHFEFCRDHSICISTSLDGPSDLHDSCRRLEDGRGSYATFVESLGEAKEIVGADRMSALMTATRSSLGRFPEIVDEYVARGFRSIFFRSLNPYGHAVSRRADLGYDSNAFLKSYREGLDYILDLNVSGCYFPEDYATILLTRILTPFGTGFVDLQSPTGAGIGCAIYDYDGNVYVSDEGRMLARLGDRTFLMGNVHRDKYEDMFGGMVVRRTVGASCVECLPRCADCAYNVWCGADPVRNYATRGDLVVNKTADEFCLKNSAIIEYLFEKVLSDGGPHEDVAWSWITRRSLQEVRLPVWDDVKCEN